MIPSSGRIWRRSRVQFPARPSFLSPDLKLQRSDRASRVETQQMASIRLRSLSPSNEYEYDLDGVLGLSEPVIDLHLPAYETSVTNFLWALANFTSRSVADITQRRDAHDNELKRLAVQTKGNRPHRSSLHTPSRRLVFVHLSLLSCPTEQFSNTNARRRKRLNPPC